jgi:dTDP-4-dehydrorhamnose reductase
LKFKLQADLTDSKQVDELLKKKPDMIIHAAAEKRPDVAAKNEQKTRQVYAFFKIHISLMEKQADI